MTRKPGSERWTKALRQAVAGEAEPPAAGEAGGSRAGGARVPFSTYLPAQVAADLRQLAHRLSIETGRRVSVADLAAQAIERFLKTSRK